MTVGYSGLHRKWILDSDWGEAMTSKKKFDARKMMELAVSVMMWVSPVLRVYGTDCPRVGAVIVFPDGRVDTASRGELRNGDHAEFTLIDRKYRDQKLDGARLFATLEPCAPGSRHPPKMSY